MTRKLKILVVDDEKINRNLLVGLLNDYQVIMAKNGDQALKRANSDSPPDLILLDIVMPGMDGFEVCEKLKSSNKTINIPVIFLTGKSNSEDIVRGFKIGGSDYVTKPFCPEELLARVEMHLKLQNTIKELKCALIEVKTLSKLIPICSNCKKVRDDKGYWQQVDEYITLNTETKFSHSICNDCVKDLYPSLADEVLD